MANVVTVKKKPGTGTRQPTLPEEVWKRVFPVIHSKIGVGKQFQVLQVATALGISSASVSTWINNKGHPTFANLVRCLKFIGENPRELAPELYDEASGEAARAPVTHLVLDTDEAWRSQATVDGLDPDDPLVAEVYKTAFKDAKSMIGYAAAEVRRRKASEKGKAAPEHNSVDAAEADELALLRRGRAKKKPAG